MPSYSLQPAGLLILMASALAIIVTGLTCYLGLSWYIGLALFYGGLALAQLAFLGMTLSGGAGKAGALREAAGCAAAGRHATGRDRA